MSDVRSTTGKTTAWKYTAGAVIWVIVVIVFASAANIYYTGLVASIGILALLGLGMVLVTGYAGQFSLAVGAFYGIGAYGSAVLTVKFGWYSLLALAVAALISGAVGYLLARPLFRLRGHFLAMATLALTEVFFLLVTNLQSLGGSSGIGGINPLNLFGLELTTPQSFVVFNWLLVGAVLWGSLMLRHGREGRSLLAIRSQEAAAASAGINIVSAKTRIFTASAVISAVAGSLYAHQTLYVNPPPFGLETAIEVLMIAVLGGMRSPWGAILGAAVLEFLNQGLQAVLPGLVGTAAVGAGQQLMVGVILVLILVLRPDGVAGAISTLARTVGHRRRAPGAATDGTEDPIVEESTDMAALRRRMDDEEPPREFGDVVLAARDLVKRFGGVKAVNKVTLDLRAGEVLAVIGPNGAGKSTLVNILSGNLSPTSGDVSIADVETTGMKASQIARHGLARTFQTPSLFDEMDVEATVKVGAHLRGKVGMLRSMVPTPGAVREERRLTSEVAAALDRLGLRALAHHDAKSLSLGQQKLVEIARALVMQPRIILLDEPCAGLNKQEKTSLMRLLRSLGRDGLAVLVIEHDMEFVMASADRVQVLNFGATLRTGSPEEVQEDPAVIDAYLGVSHENEPVTTTNVAVVPRRWRKK